MSVQRRTDFSRNPVAAYKRWRFAINDQLPGIAEIDIDGLVLRWHDNHATTVAVLELTGLTWNQERKLQQTLDAIYRREFEERATGRMIQAVADKLEAPAYLIAANQDRIDQEGDAAPIYVLRWGSDNWAERTLADYLGWLKRLR